MRPMIGSERWIYKMMQQNDTVYLEEYRRCTCHSLESSQRASIPVSHQRIHSIIKLQRFHSWSSRQLMIQTWINICFIFDTKSFANLSYSSFSTCRNACWDRVHSARSRQSTENFREKSNWNCALIKPIHPLHDCSYTYTSCIAHIPVI